MMGLDTAAILDAASATLASRIDRCDVFPEIDSTNDYLMSQRTTTPGRFNIAITDNQTAGRGRHGKVWESSQGTGLCLSVEHTFVKRPRAFSSLTLAVGIAAIDALSEFGVDAKLKWPNDLIVNDGKLAGILTEVKNQSAVTTTVVVGIGLNIDLPDVVLENVEIDRSIPIRNLKAQLRDLPATEVIAGVLLRHLCNAIDVFESNGFESFVEKWGPRDWLLGKALSVETADSRTTGIGAGIADDGALLLDTVECGLSRITAGSIVLSEPTGAVS